MPAHKLRIALIEATSEKGIQRMLYQIPRILEPLGLCFISAVLEKNGFQARVFQQLDTSNEVFLKEILDFEPDVIGFSCLSVNYNNSLFLANALKKSNPKLTIVFGGYHPSLVKEIVFEKSIDYVVVGEGEFSLLHLVTELEKNNSEINFPGIISKKNFNNFIPAQRITGLDELPFPSRNSLPMEKYLSYSVGEHEFEEKTKYASVYTSRGCCYNCDFCCTPILYSKGVFFRSPKNVVDEIELLSKKYGVNQIDFRDEDLTLNKKRLIEICDELIKRKLNVKWRAFGNVKEVNKELLEKMKQAGCSSIFYGIDGVNNEALKKMHKPYVINDIISCFELTHEIGLYIVAGVILGYPDDSQEIINEWLELLKIIQPETIYISLITAFIGTPLHEKLKKENKIISFNPSDYDCSTQVVKNNFVSKEEIAKWQRVLYEKYYNSNEWRERAKINIANKPSALFQYKLAIECSKKFRNIQIKL